MTAVRKPDAMNLSDLIPALASLNLRLRLADADTIAVDGDANLLTAAMRTALVAHKETLLAMLRAQQSDIAWSDTPAADGPLAEQRDWWSGLTMGPVCTAKLEPLLGPREPKPPREPDKCDRCGSAEYIDVVLHHEPHDGESTRRDCARCGRTIWFPRWHGRNDTLPLACGPPLNAHPDEIARKGDEMPY